MKAALLLFLIPLFSIYSFSFISAREAPEVVRDDTGKILRTDAYYYVLPANSGNNGGGLTVDGVAEEQRRCPQGVVQEPYQYAYGSSLKFYPVNLKKGVVRLSTDLNIEFSALNNCGETNVWKLGYFDHDMEKYFVGVDGAIGKPGAETLSNWFKIEKMGNGYKFVYCPSVCSYCDPICQNVGIVYHHGKSRLALTDSEPLNVIFKKA